MFDALILAGGSSQRLDGADKAALQIGGTSLLDRAVQAAGTAHRIIVVGPRRDTARAVIWAQEDPPGSGPVAAIAAGLQQVQAPWVLTLAADSPWVAPAVPVLLTSAADADVAVLSRQGRRNYLAAVWRADALRAAVKRLDTVADAAVKQLFSDVEIVDVPDEADWSADLDTWADIEQARAREKR